MSTVALEVAAVRARFSALDTSTAFLDGPGGTQVPDSVIEAMATCLREANANLGGPFETSRRADAVVEDAHEAAARLLGASLEEVGFGQNMTTLNFALTRTLGRELEAGDEIVVTRLDHDGNVAPWLELARDLDLVVRSADLNEEDCTLDVDDLQHQLSGRTRVVAFPWASNAVGSISPVRRIAELAHDAGALAWVDAVHYAAHGPIDAAAVGADILICSPYKFFGPHLGLFFARREVVERWRPYKVRPSADEPVAHRFETGTLSHESLAGFTAAVEYLESLGWEAIQAHERELGQRFLDGLPSPYRLYGVPSMEGRVPTFAVTHPHRSPEELAARLSERDIATWPGN
jgi:cysteine desulfurase family protein (TIGR01976 family)